MRTSVRRNIHEALRVSSPFALYQESVMFIPALSNTDPFNQ